MAKFTYQMEDTEMYMFFKRVCKKNWKRNAKICKECPFKGFIASAAQSYALRNNLEDPLISVNDI